MANHDLITWFCLIVFITCGSGVLTAATSVSLDVLASNCAMESSSVIGDVCLSFSSWVRRRLYRLYLVNGFGWIPVLRY